ncbi:hypothetical protein WICMUC_001091 [Wickerhamomyces mucosus]|uniref:Histone acetyltransferase type B catalytic subunit n=1 Tax=Wickerhamomyces mucosus TaxID=1378264 RepID=A0A9P8THU4_9ASCO|nr:hypothetical protein WICMUC_001091 [Wickerhamomyces mucosus]
MSYQPETWTTSSNDLSISICDSEGKITFNPLMTYAIFGDSEQIFGYKDLKINLAFDSITFLPYLRIDYSEKLNDDVEDIQKKLLEFLPDDTVVQNEVKWVDTFNKEQTILPDYTTLFHKIDNYNIKNQNFTIYKTNFAIEYSIKLLKRLQIFVLLYIEAGSYIDTSDLNWDLFLVVNDETKKIIGFSTTYSYFKYKGAKEFDSTDKISKRNKISQFIILPPYQGSHHGYKLYESIVNHWLNDSLIEDIVVEDPNESFDNLRYKLDFKRLFNDGLFNKLPKSIDGLNKSWFIENSKLYKIEINQFKKLVEIAYIFQNNIKLARLLIKKRLYEKNKDGLDELDDSIKKDKLQTAFEAIKGDYNDIIKSLKLDSNDDGPLLKKIKV